MMKWWGNVIKGADKWIYLKPFWLWNFSYHKDDWSLWLRLKKLPRDLYLYEIRPWWRVHVSRKL